MTTHNYLRNISFEDGWSPWAHSGGAVRTTSYSPYDGDYCVILPDTNDYVEQTLIIPLAVADLDELKIYCKGVEGATNCKIRCLVTFTDNTTWASGEYTGTTNWSAASFSPSLKADRPTKTIKKVKFYNSHWASSDMVVDYAIVTSEIDPYSGIVPINPYELLINGTKRNYIKVHYVKNHPDPDPDTFDVTVNYDVGELVNYFDSVEVRKNGVTEFYGFVEDIDPQKGTDGLEYLLTGRCWKVLVWKKSTERFQESREIGPEDSEGNVETGFFGSVYPHELFRFLLRCPISDHPKGKVRHKIGWGIASDFWKCCANVTADTFYPDWVMLRYTGLSWRGRASTANLHYVDLICDSFDSTYVDWTENGSSPYLDTDSDVDNIATGTPPNNRKEGYFGFDDLVGTAERIYGIKLYIKSNIQGYASKIAVHLNDGTSNYNLGYLTVCPYGYGYTEFNCITVLDTPTKVNNAKIYFDLESGYHAMVTVIYAYFHVEYSTTADADINQKTDDWFVINLGADYDMVTAMLIECRNNPNMYARNYKIQYCTISDCCAEGDNDGFWSDFDDDGSPINVVNNTARDILHSWKPQDNVHGIRIKLTADADPPWEISQIYVWRADESKYRLLDE